MFGQAQCKEVKKIAPAGSNKRKIDSLANNKDDMMTFDFDFDFDFISRCISIPMRS